MKVRTAFAIAALAVIAPFAAYADAPSGDFADVIGPQTSVQAAPQFPRAEHRNYVEGNAAELTARTSAVTVEEVRAAIAAAPLPMIGG